MRDQDGVVNRRQLLEAGFNANDVRRLVRRRELFPLHPGVYLHHAGTPSWHQSAWAAVLACEPAALAGPSALRLWEGPTSSRADRIHLAIEWERRLRVPGIEIERRRDFHQLVQVGSPPRIRLEDSVIDVADAAGTDLLALDELSRPLQRRATTPARLLSCAQSRARLARRLWLEAVLADLDQGACSVLEHGYLTRVERPHGLPVAHRQVRDRISRGVIYRDVEYDVGLVAELDGRVHHDSLRGRDRDFDRDLEATVLGKRSVRLSYGQVYDRPCWTGERIGRVLMSLGWQGRPRACRDCA